MEEQNKMIEQAIEELKSSDDAKLNEVIEQWFERTRTQGLKLGAKFISATIYGAIEKHLKKTTKPSLRDYQRCVNEIIQIVSVQLKQNTEQNDLIVEDITNEQESSI